MSAFTRSLVVTPLLAAALLAAAPLTAAEAADGCVEISVQGLVNHSTSDDFCSCARDDDGYTVDDFGHAPQLVVIIEQCKVFIDHY